MTRREILALAGAAPACLTAQAQQGAARLWGAPSSFGLRSRGDGATPTSFDILEHCHKLGLGGVQMALQGLDPEPAKQLRQKTEGYGMQLILDVPALPTGEDQLFKFGIALQLRKDAGAVCLHAAMTQRRYEQYDSLDAFRKDFQRCQSTIALIEPVLRKYRMKLAIENHKGWRAAEQATWLRRLDSEWVGVCFDFGNNMALCEDPMDTLKALAPYAFMCHLKDMAVEGCQEGFLLSEVPLGEGILDLKQMVQVLRQKDPNLPFCLEMITRDPLTIPVFTDKYWATFDDSTSPLPGRDLAKILQVVRRNPPKQPLARITGLSREAALKLEDENNQKCIEYARQTLNL